MLRHLRELKDVVFQSMFSELSLIHCSKCDDFVEFRVSEISRDRVRVYGLWEIKTQNTTLNFNCPKGCGTIASFKGKETSRFGITKKE